MHRRSRVTALLAFAVVGPFALASCGDDSGSLSDAEYAYCVNDATPRELAAAASALNIQVNAEAFADGSLDQGDPIFVQVCEHAYQARGRDLDLPGDQPVQPGGPLDDAPTAPLDPQSSLEVLPTPLRSTSP